jgi:DNA-binding MltR family transcriptional regulator
MTSDATHPILKTHPHLKDFMVFLEHLSQESERGQVLITASMLDDLLLQTLKAFIIEGSSADKLLVGFSAPIGTYAARIEAAHALGLISKQEHHDATIIRKIRNRFAHNLSVSFEDQDIKDRCAILHFRAKNYDDINVSARGQFSTAGTALILNLTNRAHYAGTKRIAWQPWPY